MIGMVAGLAEAGVDLTAATDLVIGTSAGANAAVQVRSGKGPAELLSAVLAPLPARRSGQGQPVSAALEAVFARMRTISAAATSAAELQRAMAAYALESDAKFGPEVAEQRRAM